jgi:hypothetical protein
MDPPTNTRAPSPSDEEPDFYGPSCCYACMAPVEEANSGGHSKRSRRRRRKARGSTRNNESVDTVAAHSKGSQFLSCHPSCRLTTLYYRIATEDNIEIRRREEIAEKLDTMADGTEKLQQQVEEAERQKTWNRNRNKDNKIKVVEPPKVEAETKKKRKVTVAVIARKLASSKNKKNDK